MTNRPGTARSRAARRGLPVAAFLLAAAMAPAAAQDGAPAYVGSAACAGCHQDVSATWAGSHHALAWTEAGPDTVVADFDGTTFRHDGALYRFRIAADGSYHVTVREADGTTADHRVHSVAGIEPLQQYLIETEPGRLQSFDVVWDTGRGTWFHLYPDQHLPPSDGLHWTGPYKNWNTRCAECHATGFVKNYDPARRRYASRQAEIGVGCEACHGPGEAHLAFAEGRALPETETPLGPFGLTIGFDDAGATIGQCAACHARREAFGDGNPLPGTRFHDAYGLALLRPGLYHADGQILDEVYVYGSFLQSRMYAAGVSCLDCHDPHTAAPVAAGNAVCTQCHNPAGNDRFETLVPADYDSPAHHFHEPGTAGATCASCHMIERTYMGVDGRRDHSFRVPRPDLAAVTGAPDACTDCHADETAAWAAARIAAWYPDSDNRGPHYGETLAAGRADPAAAAASLARLAGDPDTPGIVRATALWLLEGAGDPEIAGRIAPMLADPDPVVRAAAARLQRTAPPTDRVARLAGLLDDPVRSVRMAAAQGMLNAPVVHLPPAIADDLATAMGEWRASLSARLDFPETHLQIGGVALTMRNPAVAEGAFREVVRLDPQRIEAWTMLARIAAAISGPEATLAVLTEARAANPDDATLAALEDEVRATMR